LSFLKISETNIGFLKHFIGIPLNISLLIVFKIFGLFNKLLNKYSFSLKSFSNLILIEGTFFLKYSKGKNVICPAVELVSTKFNNGVKVFVESLYASK